MNRITTIETGDTILGKYRVDRVLGRGGMGFVVAARHTQLDELYAIKIMLPTTFENEIAGRRFVREARVCARLKGEHVAHVHDVGQTEDGTFYMVMEHLEGTDFKELLATQGRLEPEDAAKYILQACNALMEAHEMGLIHRDIKPANLFLTRKRRSGEPLVKVLDFGISKDTSLEKSADLTGSGAVLGSPLYMSPEQLLNSRDVDARSDIWSLGVVLYELIAGVPPFAGETFTQLALNILNRAPQPIRSHAPEVSAAFDAVLHRCLAKEPDQRYQTIEAFVKALETVLKDGLQSLPDGPEFAPTIKEPLVAPKPNADVNPLGSTHDVGIEPANVPVLEVVEKNADQVISSKPPALEKDTLPAATTLQSVAPPADSTVRPTHPERRRWVPAVLITIAVVVAALVLWSQQKVGADGRQTAQVPTEITSAPQSAVSTTVVPNAPAVEPKAPTADASRSAQPIETQESPVASSTASTLPSSLAVRPVGTKKPPGTDGNHSTSQMPPVATGTVTASAPPKPSGTIGWRQGPL